MDAAVALSGVSKTFGGVPAVDRLDLQIPRGSLCGVIGPNGAGKTTTIRMIMSILFPDSGQVSVLGRASALEAKDRIGYLPEERGVYRKMRVGAFLSYMARLKGMSESEVPPAIPKMLDRVGLAGVESKRCEELSKGMLQKVQLIAAVMHRPDLLILDEPFSGLDPVSARSMREMILEEHARGATILFSTHVMPHAEEICEHVVMIHRGRKMLDDSMAGIRRQYDVRTVRFEPIDASASVERVRALPFVTKVQRAGDGYEVLLADRTDPAAAIQAITGVLPVARIEIARPRLEDVFVRIVGGAGEVLEDAVQAALKGQDAGAMA
ncbi:MAG TPA: ATP-binding cassette domain-containing protein [Vicinamibacterales bacterium]|nr:ATP-binding cassette domain-containing protein [Vicinamibacterales bacterium]